MTRVALMRVRFEAVLSLLATRPGDADLHVEAQRLICALGHGREAGMYVLLVDCIVRMN